MLYIGTPVVLVSSLNPDGRANLSPMSGGRSLEITPRGFVVLRETFEVGLG